MLRYLPQTHFLDLKSLPSYAVSMNILFRSITLPRPNREGLVYCEADTLPLAILRLVGIEKNCFDDRPKQIPGRCPLLEASHIDYSYPKHRQKLG